MLTLADKTAVKSFLRISRELVKLKKCKLIPRVYNINGELIGYKDALLNIGILNINDIWKYIINLKEKECFRISRDYNLKMDMNSEIFEFKTNINNKKVYIKLTLRTIREDTIICLSFHESDR